MKSRQLLTLATIIASFSANAEPPELCPNLGLPEEIQIIRDDIEGILTLTPKDKGFLEQWSNYNAAVANFEETYKDEIEKADAMWQEFKDKQFPSELRFNSTVADNPEDGSFLKEIKGACWEKVMGLNEYIKYSYCNPIQKTPTKYEWNNIFTCTVERSQLLGVKLYR